MFNIFILFYFAEDEKRYQNENVATAGLVYGSPDRVQNAAPRMARESRPQRAIGLPRDRQRATMDRAIADFPAPAAPLSHSTHCQLNPDRGL